MPQPDAMSGLQPRLPGNGIAPGPARHRAADLVAWLAAGVMLVVAVALHRVPLNRDLLLAGHALGQAAPAFWSSMTLLGLGWSAWIIVAAVDRHRGHLRVAFVACLILVAASTHLAKVVLAVPRPQAVLDEHHLPPIGEPIRGGGSFPSGHAASALAVAIILSRAGGPLALRIVVYGVALAVSWSRVAVAAHWPADVLAGAAIGIASGLVGWRWLDRGGLADWLGSMTGQRMTAAAEWGAAAALVTVHTGYPDGRLLQLGLAILALASGVWRWMACAGDPPAPRGRHP